MIILIYVYILRFKQAWAEVDPKATGYIKKKDVAKLFQLLHGRFKINIYDKQYSFDNLYRLGFQQTLTLKSSHSDTQFNYKLVNQCLSTMDSSQIEKRRKQYNLLYMVIKKNKEKIKNIHTYMIIYSTK